MLAALALVATSACAKRLDLKPDELNRVQTEAGVNPLRVYVSKRLVTRWVEAEVAQSFEVDRKITEASSRQALKNVLTKSISGQILDIEDSNGMPLLFVTFDASCADKSCAFQFVQTEDSLYRLVEAPPLDGHEEPKNYYHCFTKNQKRLMKLGKMKSLGEANDVLVWKKRNGKLRTVHLQVIKVIDNRTRTRTRRSGGVD